MDSIYSYLLNLIINFVSVRTIKGRSIDDLPWGAPELNPSKSVFAGDTVLRTSPGTPSPWDSALGDIEDSISQCPFLQMTYTTENPHADGSTASEARPRFRPPSLRDPHTTSCAPTTTGWREDRCPVISKLPLHSHAAAKMSPHIIPHGRHIYTW